LTPNKKVNPNVAIIQLDAKISSINQLGVAIILFNDDIYPLGNYSLWENFNDTNLKVSIKAGPYSDIKNLNFTFNCTDFSKR